MITRILNLLVRSKDTANISPTKVFTYCRKRVQLPQNCFGTPTCPLFHCVLYSGIKCGLSLPTFYWPVITCMYYMYKREQALSCTRVLRLIHLFSQLLKGDQFHAYQTYQNLNAFYMITKWFLVVFLVIDESFIAWIRHSLFGYSLI